MIKKMIEVEYINGKIKVDPRTVEVCGGWDSAGNLYEPELVNYVYEALKKYGNQILFDVGACTGSFTLLQTLIPNLTVFSFEANPETFDILKSNCGINDCQATLINAAVSNHDGEVDFYNVSKSSKSLSCIAPHSLSDSRKYYRKVRAQTVTLNRICEQYIVVPDFIKIDVEGAEYKVLQGALQILEFSSPEIVMEYH